MTIYPISEVAANKDSNSSIEFSIYFFSKICFVWVTLCKLTNGVTDNLLNILIISSLSESENSSISFPHVLKTLVRSSF